MRARKLACPSCGKRTVKPDGLDDRGRWGFTSGDKDPCGGCGAKLFVRVTDDYAPDYRVTVHMGRDPEAIAQAWNAAHPIGTRVRYWPVRPTSSTLPIETRTTSIGYVNSGGDHASIMVEGVSGSVNLSTHVDALPAEASPLPAGSKPAAYRYDVEGFPPIWANFRIGDVPGQTEVPLYDATALEAARREERERCAREFCEAMGAHPSGSWDGVLDVARLLKDVCEKTIERRNEAAKGQAK